MTYGTMMFKAALIGLSNIPYSEMNQPILPIHTYFEICSDIVLLTLGLPRSPFPAGLPVTILEVLLPSSILVIFPGLINPLVLVILSVLSERHKL